MNRIVLIGNGFDLAHGLKTKYEDFIDWYWEQRVHDFSQINSNVSKDSLCTFEVIEPYTWSSYASQYIARYPSKPIKKVVYDILSNKDCFKVRFSPFFDNIRKSIETKRWVDIEEEYYRLLTKYALEDKSENNVYALNDQLAEMRGLLIEYLSSINAIFHNY